MTRDRERTRRLDLSHESRPYEYGIVGRSTPDAMTGSPAPVSHDGRRDSATALIGTSSMGSIPMASAPSIQGRGGDVGRQSSRSSNLLLPPGAAPPRDYHSSDGGSASGSSTTPGPSGRRPLQVVNPPLSPRSMQSGAVPGSSMVAPEPERPSAWSEKQSAQVLPSSRGPDPRPSVSGSGGVPENKPFAQPEPTTPEPTEAPPAYVA